MRSAIKYHGGKYYLRHQLLSLMPPHVMYIEPFAGGAQFFFFKPPSFYEVLSDVNAALINMWTIIRDEPEKLLSILRPMPYAESSFVWATAEEKTDPAVKAAQTFIKYRQSIGGRGKSWARPSKSRLRRGKPDNISAWESALDLIAPNSKRLKDVEIVCSNALDLIPKFGANNLIYLDPPYLPSTRAAAKVYDHEMTLEDHKNLLDVILKSPAQIMISGYDNDLYNEKLKDWKYLDINISNHAAGGKKKREMRERIWHSSGVCLDGQVDNRI